jgi:hypothetical protein
MDRVHWGKPPQGDRIKNDRIAPQFKPFLCHIRLNAKID